MRFEKPYKGWTTPLARRLNVAVAFALTLATAAGPLVGVALHDVETRHLGDFDHAVVDLHSAGCDHGEGSAHHDADTCVACRLLSQVKTSVLTRRAALPLTAPVDSLLRGATALVPAPVALPGSVPRAPPSLL